MGAGQSQARIKGVNREELLRATTSSRDFTNKLFNAMIKNLTPEDVLALGNPASCSKFIFLLADNFQRMFQTLRIKPTKQNPRGIILFQHVDKLAKTAETRAICLEIAYFFIRIFQIFGALAITVLDDPGAGQVLDATRASRGFFQPRLGDPMRGRQLVPLTGGDLSRFSILQNILNTNDGILYKFNNNSNIELIPNQNKIRYSFDSSKVIEATININQQFAIRQSDIINISLTKFNYKGENSSLINANINKIILDLKIKTNFSITPRNNNWIVRKSSSNLSDFLQNAIFYPLQEKINMILINPQRYQQLVKPEEYMQRTVGVLGPFETKYIKETLESLSSKKSISFCVARALQLLDANALLRPPPKSATSRVCAATFEAAPFSVPQPDSSIINVPGLHALDQLYYTQIGMISKKVEQDKVDTTFEAKVPEKDTAPGGDYANFLKEISSLFGKDAAKVYTDMKSINGRGKPVGCPAQQAIQQTLQITDPNKINKIAQIMSQMFGRQLAHTNKVIQLFRNELFLIRTHKDSLGHVMQAVDIHPKLLRGGIDAVNNLSKLARDILLKYYSDCEKMYTNGVQEIFNISQR